MSKYALTSAPPCARYEGGENNERLIKVWDHVTGNPLAGHDITRLTEHVARLYDHKGFLFIVTRRDLPECIKALFRHAWATVGREFAEHVEFNDVRSNRWRQIWACRRFESDWQNLQSQG